MDSGWRRHVSCAGDGHRAGSLVLEERVHAGGSRPWRQDRRIHCHCLDRAEKAENLCRHGVIRPTSNGHAFEHADGTPYYMLGDTWWLTPTFRFRWTEDDTSHPMGPEATFKDMVKFRRTQGFNAIAMIAAWPNWANDGKPNLFMDDADKTMIRSAWAAPKTGSAKDQHNEGGKPFRFLAACRGSRMFRGRGPRESQLLPIPRQEDRLFEFPGVHSVH